jgi:Zinc finger, C3HC4 type (RING finger)
MSTRSLRVNIKRMFLQRRDSQIHLPPALLNEINQNITMASCKGDGSCLNQCVCECYNKRTGKYHKVCKCGHRKHNEYCPSDCCIPLKCRNYKYCNDMHPKWFLNCHNGMDMNCAMQMGPHVVTTYIRQCYACKMNKQMITLKCEHNICSDCWYNITSNEGKHRCPLCGKENHW